MKKRRFASCSTNANLGFHLDFFRMGTVVPVAFRDGAKKVRDPERDVCLACWEVFRLRLYRDNWKLFPRRMEGED